MSNKFTQKTEEKNSLEKFPNNEVIEIWAPIANTNTPSAHFSDAFERACSNFRRKISGHFQPPHFISYENFEIASAHLTTGCHIGDKWPKWFLLRQRIQSWERFSQIPPRSAISPPLSPPWNRRNLINPPTVIHIFGRPIPLAARIQSFFSPTFGHTPNESRN